MSATTDQTLPLSGIKVLDFSTLLPGPLASLILAEAGAEVVKIERPESGDAMRAYPPLAGTDSVSFALLNRGKRSLALDLKRPGDLERLAPLIAEADVLIEQFRPGVMERLGLGYGALKERHKRLIYCSITGRGQDGPKSGEVGHDLTYMAEAGLLSLAADPERGPCMPPVLVADIAGGTYPAVINILLALRRRDASGEGCHLDIAMTEQVLTFAFAELAELWATGKAPQGAAGLLTGGSPRYRIYPTADGRYLAVAALEDKFWRRFAELIQLPEPLRDDSRDPKATMDAVGRRILAQPSAHWRRVFSGEDVSSAVVVSLEEAVADQQLAWRRVFEAKLSLSGGSVPALPVPVVAPLRRAPGTAAAPALAEWAPTWAGWA
ncbi:MAG: CoA transferase [Proteobacteria bacterium]|nr:CoA transferase [Pseudomonadota bacterium]MBI3499164.1 CoA transferase [Pseudomonadota bacterium]